MYIRYRCQPGERQGERGNGEEVSQTGAVVDVGFGAGVGVFSGALVFIAAVFYNCLLLFHEHGSVVIGVMRMVMSAESQAG